MNTAILATNPENFIFASNDDLRTTSLKVAEAFGKLHKDVLRKIQTLDCSPEFNQRNFAPVEYVDAKGEKRAAYEMTKDGFMFLVMGFTGKAAAQIKEAYINAFNLMHDKLFPKRNGLVDLPPATPKTITPIMQRQVQKAISHLVRTQVGTTYSGLYGQIKDKFGVGTYKDVPFKRYGELCAFLHIEPTAQIELAEVEHLPANEKLVMIGENQCMKIEDFMDQFFREPNSPYVMIKRDALTALRTLFNSLL